MCLDSGLDAFAVDPNWLCLKPTGLATKQLVGICHREVDYLLKLIDEYQILS